MNNINKLDLISAKHNHQYVKKTKVITLMRGTAKDTLKQWVCECGKTTTYDLERVKF